VDFGFVDRMDRGSAADLSASPEFSPGRLSEFFQNFKLGRLNESCASPIGDAIVQGSLVENSEERCRRAQALFTAVRHTFREKIDQAAGFVLQLLEPTDQGGQGLQVEPTPEVQQAVKEHFSKRILELQAIKEQFFQDLFGETQMRAPATPARPSAWQPFTTPKREKLSDEESE
jgi:hypothetical protein